MIAKTVTFGWPDVLLIIGILLFGLGCMKTARHWFVPLGLAFFAATSQALIAR